MSLKNQDVLKNKIEKSVIYMDYNFKSWLNSHWDTFKTVSGSVISILEKDTTHDLTNLQFSLARLLFENRNELEKYQYDNEDEVDEFIESWRRMDESREEDIEEMES
jgi:hypothetical protein